ncbi:hypothetical protein HanIR_Chr11g0514411 [Helianthus annuus]|nr:hypothetical protein HanIR_Chr11g0514411 [Helianthus annuus]
MKALAIDEVGNFFSDLIWLKLDHQEYVHLGRLYSWLHNSLRLKKGNTLLLSVDIETRDKLGTNRYRTGTENTGTENPQKWVPVPKIPKSWHVNLYL